MTSDYEDVAFKLKVGEHSDVISMYLENGFGEMVYCYCIIQRLEMNEDHIDANFISLKNDYYNSIINSDLDKIKLLPAVPTEWKSGKAANLHVRGGLHVSIEWNENEVIATISADFDKNVHIGAPCGYNLVSSVGSSSKHGDGFVYLELKAGDTVKLTYVK
jgi:hypothetical protein